MGASSLASGKTKEKSKNKNFQGNQVTMADFKQALEEVKTAFTMDSSGLENKLIGGVHSYGVNFDSMWDKCLNCIEELRESKKTQILTVLLEGNARCGKTAIAAKLALESNFPYVKLISPENFVGFNEHSKLHAIVKVFDDAYKSNLSLVILDDIERLIEFIHIGPRFSNPLLQALLVLVKKCPPTIDRKLMIIGTTSQKAIMQEMDLVSCFNVCLNVPYLTLESEVIAILSQFSQD